MKRLNDKEAAFWSSAFGQEFQGALKSAGYTGWWSTRRRMSREEFNVLVPVWDEIVARFRQQWVESGKPLSEAPMGVFDMIPYAALTTVPHLEELQLMLRS